MPVTIDEVTADVDSGAPRAPGGGEGERRPAPQGDQIEERLRLAEERELRLRAD